MTLSEWAQLLLYLSAAFVLRTLVVKIYLAVKRYTDRVIPDNEARPPSASAAR